MAWRILLSCGAIVVALLACTAPKSSDVLSPGGLDADSDGVAESRGDASLESAPDQTGPAANAHADAGMDAMAEDTTDGDSGPQRGDENVDSPPTAVGDATGDSDVCSGAAASATCALFLAGESPNKRDIVAFDSVVGAGRRVVYKDSASNLVSISNGTGSWANRENLTQLTGAFGASGGIAAWAWDAARSDEVAYVAGSQVYLYSNDGSGWRWQLLTANGTDGGVPWSVPDGPVTGLSYGSNVYVGYISVTGDVVVLTATLTDGGSLSWSAIDATLASGAPQARTDGTLESFASAAYSGLNWAYLTSDGAIHVIYSDLSLSPSSFADSDFTYLTGGPVVGSTTLAVSVVDSRLVQMVSYLSSDGHVHLDYYAPPTRFWRTQDLTRLAGAPNARLDRPLTQYYAEGAYVVGFVSADDHVQQLSCSPDHMPDWTVTDLTTRTVAPLAATHIAGTGNSTSQLIAFTAPNAHQIVLSQAGDAGSWTMTDIAADGGPNRW